MRHLTLPLALALTLAAGCVQPAPNPRVGEVLPTADSVQIKVPESAASTFRTVGQLADYYVITRKISKDLNHGAAWVLILVHNIVDQYPPTSVDGDTYTWGPWSETLDPAEWRLVVTENLDGSYDWSFDGRSKLEEGTEFLTVISGNAVPGATPHHGSGNFMIDFDAAEQVNPLENDDRGTVEIAYDLERLDGAPATLNISINTLETDQNGDDQPVNFEYAYAENADGSGDLSFEIHGDLDDEGSLPEDALIRSRWVSTGSGRADVRVKDGDLGELVVTASECWDDTFSRVYYGDSEEWMPTEGDPAECVFLDQDLPAE